MKTLSIGGVKEKIVERKDFPPARLRKILGRETVAVIGYGVQGRGQSHNMRDNGVKVIVGVRKNGPSWKLARKDGLKPGKTLFEIDEAVRRGPVVQYLLDHGADVETRHRGATALHYAAKAGFLHTARLLLDRGADPNAPNGENETPLFYAFKAGKRSDIAAMVGVLVAGGADPSYADPKGMTPARIAKRMRRPDQAKIVAALES